MPHRDPETGQFVADSDRFDDIEVATFSATIGVPASGLSGSVGFTGGDDFDFEGVEVIDYDEFVDRNEQLYLLSAAHRSYVFANSTETEDGTVTAAVAVSADPSLTDTTRRAASQGSEDIEDAAAGGGGSLPVQGGARTDDTIDVVGRPLTAMAGAPFSNSSNGVGGAGSGGEDSYESDMFPAAFGAFHPRDELFLNGRFQVWNIDDAGVHLGVTGQHVYGVVED